MALTNFIITLVGVGAIAFLMKSDLKTGTTQLRRNLKHVRTWLEEQSAAANQAAKEDIKHVAEHKPPDPKPPTPDKQA